MNCFSDSSSEVPHSASFTNGRNDEMEIPARNVTLRREDKIWSEMCSNPSVGIIFFPAVNSFKVNLFNDIAVGFASMIFFMH